MATDPHLDKWIKRRSLTYILRDISLGLWTAATPIVSIVVAGFVLAGSIRDPQLVMAIGGMLGIGIGGNLLWDRLRRK